MVRKPVKTIFSEPTGKTSNAIVRICRTINHLNGNIFPIGCFIVDDVWIITMPPLRQYEMQDFLATVLDVEPEPDACALPEEKMTRDEIGFIPLSVVLPPLRRDEFPDSAVFTLDAEPDPLLDEPSWGVGSKAPDIVIRTGKLLHPWDDDPAEKK